jgi:hypothetical protein
MKRRREIGSAGNLNARPLGCALILMVVSFSACQTGSTSADGGNPPPPPAVTATISFCDDGTADCEPASSFAVGTVRDLVIKVAWENLPAGSHMQTLEILMPAGGPYQVTQTGLDAGGATLNSLTTTRILPVAGTSIPQRQIVGNWMIRVSLDGQSVASQMVTLNP